MDRSKDVVPSRASSALNNTKYSDTEQTGSSNILGLRSEGARYESPISRYATAVILAPSFQFITRRSYYYYYWTL